MSSIASPDQGEERTALLPGLLPASPAAPAAQRIEVLDFVRGVALCGILLVNILGFGLPDGSVNPLNSGGATGANLWTWIIVQTGFEGTQRALFSMLFGASTILLTSRLEASGRRDFGDIYVRRNLWLVAFGFVNAFVFLWYGDILYAYGIAALFLFAFRKLAARTAFLIGLGALLLSTLWNGYETHEMLRRHDAFASAIAAREAGMTPTAAQDEAVAGWEQAKAAFKSSPGRIEQAVEAHVHGYWRMFRYTARINAFWQTWVFYRYFFDMFGMMLIGMALFRWGVLTLERRTALYVAMMVGGYGVGLTVNVAETRWILDHQFSALSFAQANISYDLGRLTTTLGHLGALLLFVRANLLGFVRRAFAAVGQMAVSNYMMQSVIGAILFVGLGWYNQLERHQLYYVVAAVWAGQVLFSLFWLKLFRFGPAEWLWRTLTYAKWQPMRRHASAAR